MSVLFLFLPAWIGFLWVELLKIRGSFLRFLNAWVLGFVTMLSVGQLVLIPMVALHASLSSALRFSSTLRAFLSARNMQVSVLPPYTGAFSSMSAGITMGFMLLDFIISILLGDDDASIIFSLYI